MNREDQGGLLGWNDLFNQRPNKRPDGIPSGLSTTTHSHCRQNLPDLCPTRPGKGAYSERLVVALTSTNTHRLQQVIDENLAVTDFAGIGALQMASITPSTFSSAVAISSFTFGRKSTWYSAPGIIRCAPSGDQNPSLRRRSGLPPQVGDGLAHVVQLERFDNRSNQLHLVAPNPWYVTNGSSILVPSIFIVYFHIDRYDTLSQKGSGS